MTLAIQCVGCLSFLASESYILYVALRCITGVGVGGQIVVGCTYLSEFMPPRWRAATCAAGINTVWSFGGVLVAIVAWIAYSRDLNWQYVSAVVFLCSCLQFLWIFFVSDTPHYLYSNEEYSRACAVLRKVRIFSNIEFLVFMLFVDVDHGKYVLFRLTRRKRQSKRVH